MPSDCPAFAVCIDTFFVLNKETMILPIFLCQKVIAKHISVMLWMRDLFLQCTYVCTCLSRSGMSICTHVHAAQNLELEDLGKNGASWQWRTGRTTRLVLHNVRILPNRVLNTADGLRHWESESNKVNIQWKLHKNKIKYKRRKQFLESLHKPGIY